MDRNKKNIVRLNKTELKRVIAESVSQILQEEYEGYENHAETEKESFQAKPKKEGRLNDWEINNIFGKIES